MTQLILYGTPISTYVRTVRLLLEETGTEYELQGTNFLKGETQSAAYLSKHPFGKVPTLTVDEAVIYETVAITSYLDTVFANGRFSPTDPLLKARMQQIISIIDSYLYPKAIGAVVIQRVIVPSQGGTTDLEKVEAAIAPIKTAIAAIESLIVGSPYLLGNALTLADYHLIPIFVYFSKTPEFAKTTAQAAQLLAWWNSVSSLPVVQKICA